MSVECREEGCKRPRDPKNYAIDHTIHPSSRCALALAACHAAASKGKAPDRPNLILTRSWENPTVMSPDISEFRAHAFQAAVNKARELGWIV